MPLSNDPHELLRAAMTQNGEELLELHRALVRVPSVNRGDGSPAHETDVDNLAREYLAKAGVKSEIHESAPRRGNLLAENGGAQADGRKMLWMCHADVVPAGDETAWTYPPFSATLANGRIYGRGANDCKMLVASELFAMASLARLGLLRRGALRLAIGADEEVGGMLGFGWLAETHKDFLACDMAICEGGGGALGHFDGAPVISIGSGEKGRYDVIFRMTSDGGHACSPWGRLNPVLTLNELVSRITDWAPALRIESPLFPHIARWFNVADGVGLHNLEAVINQVEHHSPGLATSLRGQSRMTLTPTVIHGGDKANQIPTEMRLVCDARLLPGQTENELRALLDELVRGLPRVEVAIEGTSGPSVSPWDGHLAGMFERATARALNAATAQVAPTWCIGATDARYVRALGTPVYGYQLIHPGADQSKLDIHCIDESIEAGMLLPCALSLAHLALDYLEA